MLANCEPNDYISNDPALPTIATLRLEWQRAEAGMELETAGEPDDWACPPPDCQHCDNGWEPCDCGSEDGRHSESCAMGPCRFCGEK